MAWAPDPMKSIAPAAATEQKIDRIVLSDRNVSTKSAGILSENGGEASPGVTLLASVDGIKIRVYPGTSGAFCARTAAGRPTEISEPIESREGCLYGRDHREETLRMPIKMQSTKCSEQRQLPGLNAHFRLSLLSRPYNSFWQESVASKEQDACLSVTESQRDRWSCKD
jgi:hypothetical protein